MTHHVWQVCHCQTQTPVMLSHFALVEELRPVTNRVAVVVAARRARQQSSLILERAKERSFRIRAHDAEKRNRKMLKFAKILRQLFQIFVSVAVGTND